jgi:PBP1b-binding outer membrane lipoprotein LpoB
MKKSLKRLIAYVGLILVIIFYALILSSCSNKSRAQRLVRQGYSKIQKGILLDPTVADSVKGVINKPVIIPEDSGNVQVDPVIDTAAFDKKLNNYDSVKRVSDSLNNKVNVQNLTNLAREKYIADLQKTNKALARSRDELMRGSWKDSTYYHEDSLSVVKVKLKGGKLDIFHKNKERKIIVPCPTTDLLLKPQTSMWKQTWFWIMSCLILVLLLVILVLFKR